MQVLREYSVMNESEQSIFFSILRISLWNREKDKQDLHSFLAKSHYSWPLILKSFEEHALLGVVADTILSLPEHTQIKDYQINRVFQHIANLHQLQFLARQAIVEVIEQLEKVGCKPILLKGEGLAQIYPVRCVRACGDVDIYVGTQDFDKAVSCMKSLCAASDVDHAKYGNHDYSISYKGIFFEIHFKPGYASVEKAEARFQELARHWLVPERCRSINILGRQILIPAQQYNILFVFEHLARHYRNSELGIRQFVDWALLLEKSDFEESVLKSDLEELHVMEVWKRLGGVLREGLGVEKIPFYTQDEGDVLAKEIIQVVMSRGNFAHQSTDLDTRGGFYHLVSIFKKSREIGLVFPEYSRLWLSRQLKASFGSRFNIMIHRSYTIDKSLGLIQISHKL